MVDADNNPGLVSDCEALLAMDRDALAGSATLNGSGSTELSANEDGVRLSGFPPRVTALEL